MTRSGITVAALALLLAAPGMVGADESRLTDRRDSAGAQDIRALIQGHGAAKGTRVTHTILTHGRWRTRRLRCSGMQKCRSFLQIFITNDRDADYERVIQIFRRDGRLQAHMHTYNFDEDCGTLQDPVCDDRIRYLGEIRAWRPTLRLVKVSFPADRLSARPIRGYGWRAYFWYRRSKPCPSYSYYDRYRDDYSCADYAPDGYGYWRHRLD